jgi:hypothetical protein
MILASVGLIWFGCQRPEKKASVSAVLSSKPGSVRAPRVSPTAGVPTGRTCPPETDDTFFFPVASFGTPGARFDKDLSNRKVYSHHLRTMREPSLSCGDAEQNAFRFTLLRSFDPPIAVRVSLSRDSVELVATKMSEMNTREWRTYTRTIVDQPRRKLSPAEWETLEQLLASSEFWSLPSSIDDGDPDGADWIVEGRVGSRYHVVDRWSPPPGSFRDLGLRFLQLSQLSVPEREVY